MNVIPLGRMILVRFLESPTPHGKVIRPHLEQTQARRAKVLAVGFEVQEVVVGDCVLVNSLTATVVGEHHLVPESAVLATL